MPWVKLDDSFFSHPKVVTAGTEAIGLYVMALTYSAHHLTDGHVPAGWVKEKAGPKARKLAAALTEPPSGFEHGLWDLNGTGWVIHDYLDYNPSRESILAKRRTDSERKPKKNQ
jgi:hypothetical protein